MECISCVLLKVQFSERDSPFYEIVQAYCYVVAAGK